MSDNQDDSSENLIAYAIDAAKDIHDPLEGFLEKTAIDPGAPFESEVLERLAALKKDERAAFEAERPRILGALLDAVAHGIRRRPEIRLEKLPRMADFAVWGSACETAVWPAGTFSSASCGYREEAVESVIDADPVAADVRAVMSPRTEWTGTASDLLGALAELAGERAAKSTTWPDRPRAPSGRLRRAATFLRKVDIEICLGREGRARTRTISITRSAPNEVGARPSASSAPTRKAGATNGFGASTPWTVGRDVGGSDHEGNPMVAPTP